MTKNESAVINEVAQLMAKCPAPSPNPYDMIGYIHACRDYQKIQSLSISVLSNFSFYAQHKNKIGRDDFEYEDDVLYAKDVYENKLEELRKFITKRIAESWN